MKDKEVRLAPCCRCRHSTAAPTNLTRFVTFSFDGNYLPDPMAAISVGLERNEDDARDSGGSRSPYAQEVRAVVPGASVSYVHLLLICARVLIELTHNIERSSDGRVYSTPWLSRLLCRRSSRSRASPRFVHITLYFFGRRCFQFSQSQSTYSREVLTRGSLVLRLCASSWPNLEQSRRTKPSVQSSWRSLRVKRTSCCSR